MSLSALLCCAGGDHKQGPTQNTERKRVAGKEKRKKKKKKRKECVGEKENERDEDDEKERGKVERWVEVVVGLSTEMNVQGA